MGWIPEFYNPDIIKTIESLEEQIADKPGFDLYRRKLVRNLVNDSARLAGFTAEELISQADTFEELIVLKDYLQSRFAGDHAWWEEYHQRRIELAELPSFYGDSGQKARFALPVNPQSIKRSNVAGLRGVGVRRNLAGQLFTQRQLHGLDPVEISNKGMNFQKFLKSRPGMPSSYYAFDIETTGLLKQLAHKQTGDIRGLASLGFSRKGGIGGLALASVPRHRPYMGEFIEETILPRHFQMEVQSRGELGLSPGNFFRRQMSEKSVLQKFIAGLGEDKSAAVLGYNIEKFDIPFMKMMAKRHGMESQLATALEGRQIVDVGDYAKAFLSQQLGGQYVGWQEGTFKDLKLNPLGWKQQALAHALGMKGALSEAAHTPFFDVKMTEHIFETLTKDQGKAAAKIWEQGGQKRYFEALKSLNQELVPLEELTKLTVRRGGQTYLDLPTRMKPQAPRSASFADRLAAGIKPAAKSVAPVTTERNIRQIFESAPDRQWGRVGEKTKNILPIAKKVGKVGALGLLIGSVAPGQGTSNIIGSYAGLGAYYATKNKTGKAGLGFAAGVAAYSIVKSVNSLMFSGRDDNYNGIEGLRHGGFAQRTRRNLTEFGSGYRGQSLMVYNQEIDPEIQEFRHRWLSDPVKKKLLKEKLEATSSAPPGDFLSEEMTAFGEDGRYKVDLSKFDWRFEDPDTLMLERKGLSNIFDSPMAIRMSGIDAPEIEHSGDEAAWMRYQQSMPYGEEAAEQAQELWGDKENLELIIDPEQRTYGRYIGLLQEQGADTPINLQMVEKGIAAALPWGESGSDLYSRRKFMQAEKRAIAAERGMWADDYYKRYLDISGAVGKRITFTSFTDLTRLGKNYSLAAAQELMSRDDVEYESWMGRYVGAKLRKSYGPIKNRFSGKDDAYNTIEGLHPGSEGLGADTLREHSAFGSGWTGVGVGAAAVGLLAGGLVVAGKIFNRFGQEITQEIGGEDLESDAKRQRRKDKERTKRRQVEDWVRKRYARYGFGAKPVPGMDGVGGWRAHRGDKFSAMGNESEGSFGAVVRSQITEFKGDFASRWDPLKKIAAEMFDDVESVAFKKLLSSEEFQASISKGQKIKELGRGAFGEAALYKAKIRDKEFSYVVKQTPESVSSLPIAQRKKIIARSERSLKVEEEALRDISGDIMPSAYGSEKGKLFMEYMPGKTVRQMQEAGEVTDANIITEIEKQAAQIAKKGYMNYDINPGNVMFDPETGRTSWIDFGLAMKNIEEDQAISKMREIISGTSETWESVTRQSGKASIKIKPAAAQSEAVSEDLNLWGGGTGPAEDLWARPKEAVAKPPEFPNISDRDIDSLLETIEGGTFSSEVVVLPANLENVQNVIVEPGTASFSGLKNIPVGRNRLQSGGTNVEIPKLEHTQSKAAKTLRQNSQYITRVPFQSASNAGKKHIAPANKMR